MRDFVADAFAHCKFIGHVKAAMPLFEKAGIAEADFDEGIIALASAKDVDRLCRQARPAAGLEPRAARQDEIALERRRGICASA